MKSTSNRQTENQKRGLTLLEVTISTLLVGMLIVACLRVTGGALRTWYGVRTQYDRQMLASQLMDEILQTSYEDPDGSPDFGVEVDEEANVRAVNYSGLRNLTKDLKQAPAAAALEILSHKLEIWDYEKEYRVFVPDDKFAKVRVKQVIFGSRVDPHDQDFYRELFKRVSPNGAFIDFLTEVEENYV